MQDTVISRRGMLKSAACGFGSLAIAGMQGALALSDNPLAPKTPLIPQRAKRVIFIFMAGGPSHVDTFDYKPTLFEKDGKDFDFVGVRTGTFGKQSKRKLMKPMWDFKQHGECGQHVSSLFPHIAGQVDDLAFIHSMHTEGGAHGPSTLFMHTGASNLVRPSMGSWISYGLGTENKDLPAYVVMTSWGTGRPNDQPLYDRLWGAGFLPTQHQGVKFRNSGDPVLYLSDPKGINRKMRRDMLDEIAKLNRKDRQVVGDPEIDARISQYEMAFRMQSSVPDLTDVSKEPKHILDSYGPDVLKPGTYAANCLLARRMAERDVRCIQLFHMGWDHHGGLPNAVKGQCRDTDQPTAALIADLRQRGLLEDTLIVWGGEFGRTIYSQGKLTATNYGRDHHPRCFTVFLAGAGIKKGFSLGETDHYCYNITKDPVHVHDLNATIMHLLGVDHKKLTYRFQGRDYRLTDIHGHLVKKILA